MKKTIKRLVGSLVFWALLLLLVVFANETVLYKTYNRYFMFDKEVARLQETYDVQIFGACHSYTSFQAKHFSDKYNCSAFDFGGAGEIVPVTYLRMAERFKVDAPEVALVEIWGLNAYETYITPEEIFELYMPANLEQLPFSPEKWEVICDYDSLDLLAENFPIVKYKDRVLELELEPHDFNYSFEAVAPHTSEYNRVEMTMRFENRGFCEMPLHLNGADKDLYYTPYLAVSDYYERQPVVERDEKMPFEEDIMKYVRKIEELCEQYGVQLIFYRAPYLSTENELKKANWFEEYCENNGLVYVDLEKELVFDVETDFLDYRHLNQSGATKATDFLAPLILSYLQ